MESIAQLDGPYIVWEGKKLLDFSSYDFLGLAQHPEVKKGAIKYTLKYGVGIPPSILRSAPQCEIESKLAHYLGKETALLFPSELEMQLQLEKVGATRISTETDNISSLKKTKDLKVADNSFLVGTMGSQGFGSSEELSQFDAICGLLSCGIGGSGAFIAGSKKTMADLRPSSALSFPVIGALDSALTLIPEMEAERAMLQKNKAWLAKELKAFSIEPLRSPRILLTFKSEDQAQAVRNSFLHEQIYLAPPQGTALYLSTTALHTPDDLDQMSVALRKVLASPMSATQ